MPMSRITRRIRNEQHDQGERLCGSELVVTDYAKRAEQHRPTDVDTLHREVRRLNAQGLKARDIADSLRMNVADVIAILVRRLP